MNDIQRMIRTKTVREVFVEKGHFLLWKPALGGKRCECFLKEHDDPNWLCRECYGSGLLGGGYVTDGKPVRFQDASFKEVESVEVQEDTTVENSLVPPIEDEFVSLSFECDLHYHIYYGCIFKFEDYCWKVVGIEEQDDDTGLPTPVRWSVTARRLQEFEGAYLFLKDVKEGGH